MSSSSVMAEPVLRGGGEVGRMDAALSVPVQGVAAMYVIEMCFRGRWDVVWSGEDEAAARVQFALLVESRPQQDWRLVAVAAYHKAAVPQVQ